MLSPEENARYAKQIILPEFKAEGQEKLRAAKVLVIGAGGLGCPVLQYLVAAGIGTIGIADGDTVSLSNLQRQVLYTEEEIGESKTKVAARKLTALNPHVRLELYPVFIDSDNALEIMKYYDLIVDGSDNFATRYLINDACVVLNKPLVSGAIYKYEGQVAVLNYKDGPTYRCLFPEPPADGESPNCADIGVIATLPGIIGAIQASEVIKIITGIGEVLSGKLLVMDTLTMQTHTFNFKLNEANKKITQLNAAPRPCEVVINSIAYHALMKLIQEDKTIQLVDVREQEEHAIANIGGINIPLSLFASQAESLNRGHHVVLYCASGVRSNNAAKILLQKGFLNVSNLKDGMGYLTGS
jgi:molybdopterin/thiamine biosynthesis adenylyltransferase/rhodanese-related sulfurtransferase